MDPLKKRRIGLGVMALGLVAGIGCAFADVDIKYSWIMWTFMVIGVVLYCVLGRCPSCKKILPRDMSSNTLYCPYCGKKIDTSDSRVER